MRLAHRLRQLRGSDASLPRAARLRLVRRRMRTAQPVRLAAVVRQHLPARHPLGKLLDAHACVEVTVMLTADASVVRRLSGL